MAYAKSRLLLFFPDDERKENFCFSRVFASNYKSFRFNSFLSPDKQLMIEIRQNKLYDCCLRVYQTANDVDDIHKHFAFVLFLLSRLDPCARKQDDVKKVVFLRFIWNLFVSLSR